MEKDQNMEQVSKANELTEVEQLKKEVEQYKKWWLEARLECEQLTTKIIAYQNVSTALCGLVSTIQNNK